VLTLLFRQKLRESVGMGVNELITLDEAYAVHAFEWQLPLSHQPLYEYELRIRPLDILGFVSTSLLGFWCWTFLLLWIYELTGSRYLRHLARPGFTTLWPSVRLDFHLLLTPSQLNLLQLLVLDLRFTAAHFTSFLLHLLLALTRWTTLSGWKKGSARHSPSLSSSAS
jgi:hypothetical protein